MIQDVLSQVEESMSMPQTRITVVGIVRRYLQQAYDAGLINDLDFDVINKEVREAFPQSRFNPYHLAHYKHNFLKKMDYVKMHKGRVTT